PKANIGILLHATDPKITRTGGADESTLVITDLDGDEAIEEASGYVMTPGPVARSGRADGGEHHYNLRPRRCPATNSTHKGACEKIDILTVGYITAPPSRHRSGNRYEWMFPP